MKARSRRGVRLVPLAVVAASWLFSAPVAAQEDADFLFSRPRVSACLRIGYAVPRASSDLFDFPRQHLTVETSDFQAPALEGELAFRASERLDVALGLGWAGSRTRSEIRHWIGEDDLPIEQTTRFDRVPLTLGVKGYLLERGRSVSRFAWVPARWSPFAGVGVGALWYSFEQEGEFVDESTDPQAPDIFADELRSEGWTPTAHLLAGLDLSLRRNLVVTGEARYSWASAELGRDFVDFDKIDLAGFQATAGLSVRF